MYENGVKLIKVEHVRDLPEIKSLNYIVPITTLPRWKAENAYDVLYHKNGEISESSRSNFFIVKGENIFTPNKDILRGITRNKVIECAKSLGFQVEESVVNLAMLESADEAFITSSTKGLLAVTQVDDLKIGDKEGEISNAIRQRFLETVNEVR
jgi:branched-chain amino acid aminotransferase